MSTASEIIDMHCHVWPDQLASKALGGNIPDMNLFGDGTVAGLALAQEEAGIARSVCLAVANTAAQVEPANRFAGALDRSRFIPFGTVHPDLPVEENLESLHSNRMLGLKLHPVFQRYRLDDDRITRILSALPDRFPVIIHVGAGGGSDGSQCTPSMLRDLAQAVPHLSVIACHFGGYQYWKDASETVHGLPVFLDTSWPPSLGGVDPHMVRDAIRSHGVDRVVFATDWPTASPRAEVAAVRALGLDENETEMVLGGNARRILEPA